MRHRTIPTMIVTLLLSWSGIASAADTANTFRFANIFNDNMVFQQKKPAGVWGWAVAGSKISARIEECVQESPESSDVRGSLVYQDNGPSTFKPVTVTTTADATGVWRVRFPAMPASFRAKRITVTDDKGKTIAISNLLVGEVWVCSGQSNMVWRGAYDGDLWNDGLQLHAIRLAKYDFTWPRPRTDLPAKIDWEVTSSKLNWPKVSYVFARNLHLKLGVPVGIINNARGGTRGISWTSWEELGTVASPEIKKELAEYNAKLKIWDSPESIATLEKNRAAVVNEWRPKVRKAVAEHWEQFDVFMKNNLDATKYAEWQEIAKKWFVEIEKKGNNPGAIPDWKVWGLERQAGEFFKGTAIKVPKMDRALWKQRPDDKDPREGWSPPAGLFNAGVVPLKGMAVAGVLFYQGENENFVSLEAMESYREVFPRVIAAHRKVFEDRNLPFGIISLAGWGTHTNEPELEACSFWPRIMEIHYATHKLTPGTGLITIHDVGHSNIHPPEKQPVGERAARWALAAVYGKPITYMPAYTYASAEIRGSKVLIHFTSKDGKPGIPDTFEGGDAKRKSYRGFVIAGKDRHWHPATAVANSKENVLEAWSALVENPVAIRYGWASLSDGNLGTTAAPHPLFRSDDWPFPSLRDTTLEGRALMTAIRDRANAQVKERKLKTALKELEILLKDDDPASARLKTLRKQLKY